MSKKQPKNSSISGEHLYRFCNNFFTEAVQSRGRDRDRWVLYLWVEQEHPAFGLIMQSYETIVPETSTGFKGHAVKEHFPLFSHTHPIASCIILEARGVGAERPLAYRKIYKNCVRKPMFSNMG